MSKKLTLKTKLKKGDIVCFQSGEGYFLGIVVRMEKFLGKPGFVVFQTMPENDITKELKKEGVDDYTRFHLIDLEKHEAEVIKPIELVFMYKLSLDRISSIIRNENQLREQLIQIERQTDLSGGMFS